MSGDPFGGSSGTNPGSTGGGCGSGGGVSGQLPVPDITGGTGGRRPLGRERMLEAVIPAEVSGRCRSR